MTEARKAVAFFPFSPELQEPEQLIRYALDGLAELGMVDESSLQLDIFEREAVAGIVLPMTWGEFNIPDGWLMARAEAYVIPKEDTDG